MVKRSLRTSWHLLPLLALALTPLRAVAQVELLPPSATAWNIGLRLTDTRGSLESPPYTVEYSPADESTWYEALPLRPVASVNGRTLFAGSILGLREGTSYEIRIVSPAGEEYAISAQTRLPPASHDGRAVAVQPGTLTTALDAARPGDVLTLTGGTYEGPFTVTRSGTEAAPITITAAEGADVVLRNAAGEIGAVISAENSNYIVLRDLTIQGHAPAPAIRVIDQREGEGSSGWVVSGCLVFGGINTGRSNWWIEDNMIIGRYAEWDGARDAVPGGTGVNARGAQHVVVHNQVSYFYDGINTADPFNRDVEWPFRVNGPQRGVDIVGNLVFAARDDGIQVDHIGVNHRVHANRVFWAFAGISLQDLSPGPVYATRNVITDVEWEAWKIMGSTRGVRLYNNSSVSAFGNVSTGDKTEDVRAMNNMFAGRRGIHLGPSEARSVWNHNGYLLSPESPAVEWRTGSIADRQEFATLADWARETGLERGGLELAPGEDLVGPIEYEPMNPPLDPASLVPSPSSKLRGRSQVIPTVTSDPSTPAAIGAYEPGEPPARYGPRRVVPGASYRGFYVDVDQLQLTTEPVGYRPLTTKERVVRLIDIYNVSLSTLAGALLALGMLLSALAWRLARTRARRPTRDVRWR